jgi:UDP-N-acetylglucosamine 2-epimerase (non-hydrolysing)
MYKRSNFHNTERPITLTEGSNTLVGTKSENIISAFEEVKDIIYTGIPDLWDGKASDRFVSHIKKHMFKELG